MDQAIGQLNDRANILDTLNRFVLSIDTRDYDTMRSCLTDTINFDYTALFGTIMPKTADQLVEEVRANHQGFRAVQHITTNHLVDVDSDAARCRANFQAQHFLPNERAETCGRLVVAMTTGSCELKLAGRFRDALSASLGLMAIYNYLN